MVKNHFLLIRMEGTTILGFVLLVVLLVTIIALVSKVISTQVDASASASASDSSDVYHTKTYLVPSWTATGELRGGSKRVTDASGTTFTSWLFW